MAAYSELPAQDFSAHHSAAQELPANNYFVSIPPAYQRHPSFLPQKGSKFEPRNSDESNRLSIIGVEGPTSIRERIKVLLRFLIFESKEYTRIMATFVMVLSLILMLIPLILWKKAQRNPNDFDEFQNVSLITTKPCVMFAGVATVNFTMSLILLALSLMSSKFRKSVAFVNAVFAIIAAIGFSSAMGACLFLSQGIPNRIDLWKWSCDNDRQGLQSYALNFHFVCKTLTLSWNFGLLQSALELYTLLVSATAFVLIKYHHFTKYGRVGKIF